MDTWVNTGSVIALEFITAPYVAASLGLYSGPVFIGYYYGDKAMVQYDVTAGSSANPEDSLIAFGNGFWTGATFQWISGL